jgi:type II secretory pathway component PulC
VAGTPIDGASTTAKSTDPRSKPAAGSKPADTTSTGASLADALSSSPRPTLSTRPTASSLDPQPAAPTAGTATLSRGEVKVALGDFGRLMSAIRGEFTPVGVKIDGVVDRSVFAKAGLKKGDIVTAVDGKPILSIDDAADLYSHASTARNLTVSVMRDGKPATLKVTIQ